MTEKRYDENNPRFRDEFGCVNDLLTGESYLCGESGFIGERDADATAIVLCGLLNSLYNENEQLKKEYYQMRNLYFENAEDICDNCKHRYLVEVKDMQGYYHQKCKKGYSECSKGTVTYCGDFELKGDAE